MYEMEGASAPAASTVRLLGPPNPTEHATITRQAVASPGRLGAHRLERRHSRVARQFEVPCRELWAPGARSREQPVLVPAD